MAPAAAALGSKYLVLTFAWFLLLLASSAVCATPLHAAAQRDDAVALKRLLAESEDVDVLDARGLTPLHVAAVRGHAAAARLLLQHHASATRADAQGMAPLHLAALGGSGEVARLLLQHGASLHAVEPTHESTALHIAAARPRRCDVAAVLLDGGASLDLKDGEGRTPYRIAVDVENAPCVELFRRWRSGPSPQAEAESSAGPQQQEEQPEEEQQTVQVTVAASGSAGEVTGGKRVHAAAESRTICLYQFDDRADDALGAQLELTMLNKARCEADATCVRHTFERAPHATMPPYWAKVSLVRDHMRTHSECEIVAWLDTDVALNAAPSALAAALGNATMFTT